MKKFCILFILSFLSCKEILANHTKGGWMYYEYLGPGSAANTLKYRITLKVYTACELSGGQFNPDINLTIFNAGNSQQLYNIPVTYTDQPNIQNCNLQECHPCISPVPTICYKIITYQTTQDLPISSSGYTISYQRCCRISNINNIQSPSNSIGETWTVTIPGTAVTTGAELNSSAKFSQNDTAIICQGNFFTFDFSATDINNDSLVYSFTSAYTGGDNGANSAPPISSPPPFSTVPYSTGFSGTQPLGSGVTIDTKTGIVSGIAPGSGVYVVTVVVSEYQRGTGIRIAEVRKSLHIQVANCNTLQAVLPATIPLCDGFTKTFSNNGNSINVQTYDWNFGDGNTSTDPNPIHTYIDTGIYILSLILNKNLPCSDSAKSIVKVFPGFHPDFDVLGQCKNTPIQFSDKTIADYGIVNFWRWNFGDAASVSNTSTIKNPTHTYTVSGNYNVQFIVASNKGCIDTLPRTITITDKPAINAGNDTLICSVDTLQLHALGTGNFLWSPNYNISSLTIPDPFVSPKVTTNYIVTLTDPFGCIGTDSVKISVVNFVTQFAQPDTTICKTDPVVLRLNSDALNYLWTETPAGNTLNNPAIKNPIATPLVTTRYHVVGSIGKCLAQNDITITPIPYPNANAGADQTICSGTSAQLNASGGSSYSWTPTAFLNNRLIANPVAVNPTASIRYVVTVTDILGCPKPVKDTILVTVAKIKADAGPRDTSVVINQPLLLQATGSTNYLWSPAQWLNNIGIASPVALPQSDIEYIVRVSNNFGCFDYDSIRVKVFNLDASLYVPSAFTPNGDGKNDVFRPIMLGMKSLDIFRVYNRWGQLLYSGTNVNEGGGWDGTFAGKTQETATYVWYAEGINYNNIKIKKKGYVVLIR